ncbi:MAG TPA: segregation/condensation protein A [Candidatus Aquicultor sp.]|jgi:segregation and condensation protein A
MAYQVKLEVFEGPFDLLLNLISRQKLDIYEVSIAAITREYLDYVDQMQEFDLEVGTEFLLMAATLLDLKAASLLPKKDDDSFDDNEYTPQEAREILIARLIEYKKFKNVSGELAARYDAESKYFIREAGLEEQFDNLVPDFLSGISKERMRKLFMAINERKVINLMQADHITPKPLSVDEYAEKIEKGLTGVRMKSFKDLTNECGEKVELITMFLAVLELYKRGVVTLGQDETFGEIVIIVNDKAGVVV